MDHFSEGEKATPPRPFYRRRGCMASLIVLAILILVGAVNALISGGNGVGNTADTGGSTPTAQATQAQPTPTPTTKHLTPTQRAVQLAQNTGPFGKSITASMNASELDLAEFLDPNGFLNGGAMVTAIKSDCYHILQAEYGNTTGLSTVDLKVSSTLQDQYGNAFTATVGECMLNADTAAKINWNNLTFDMAWGVYDYTYTHPALGS